MVSNVWVAAADNQVDVVVSHLESGNFSANSKDPNGYTPVHAAASYGHISLLRLLLERGGDINIQDNEGDTPLHHVEDVGVARCLVEEFGCDFKIKNSEGQTAADYIEEDGEFPQVVAYLRSLVQNETEGLNTSQSNNQGFLASLPAPGFEDGREIKYTMTDIEDNSITEEEREERRKKLEAIINSEDPEEALRDLIQNAVHEGLTQYREGAQDEEEYSSNKRTRS